MNGRKSIWRQVRAGVVFGLGLGLLAAALSLTPPGAALEREVGLAWLFQARGARPPPEEVFVVGVDSRSTLLLADTPIRSKLPRDVYARLIDALVARGASAIVLDIFFRDARPGEDEAFARSIAAADRVVLFERWDRHSLSISDGEIEITRPVAPTPLLAGNAAELAPFLIPLGSDRVHVYWPFAEVGEPLATLPVAAYAVHAQQVLEPQRRDEILSMVAQPGPGAERDGVARPSLAAVLSRLRAEAAADPAVGARLDAHRAACARGRPCDDDELLVSRLLDAFLGPGERVVNHYGPPPAIERLPLYLALEGDALPRDLTGTAVFVGAIDFADSEFPSLLAELLSRGGTTSLPPPAETADTHATVYGFVPGVEIAATIYANLVRGEQIAPLDRRGAALLVLALGLAFALAALALPGLWSVAGQFGLAGLAAGGAYGAFEARHLWLPLAVPLLVELPLALGVGLAVQYAGASRLGRNIARALSYLADESVVRRASAGETMPAGYDEINGVCLSTDIEAYTSYAEEETGGTVAGSLSDYYRPLGDAVARGGGRVVDFVADSMMALWRSGDDGLAPLGERERLAACRAALELSREAAALTFKTHLGEARRLKTRIGLHAGGMAAGFVGGGGHGDYGVYGDVPNTATRIEGLNKQLGTTILASDCVVEGLDDLLVRPVGTFRFKNRTGRVRVCEILGRRCEAGEELRALCEQFGKVLKRLEDGDRRGAGDGFAELNRRFPADGPTRYWYDLTRPEGSTESRPPPAEDDWVITVEK